MVGDRLNWAKEHLWAGRAWSAPTPKSKQCDWLVFALIIGKHDAIMQLVDQQLLIPSCNTP